MVNKKAETTTTSEPEDNTEQLAKEECARLARQLRLMENDRKAYLEESNASINQQRKTIRALEEENRKLEGEIEAHHSRKSEHIEGANLCKVLDLLDTYIALEEEVKKDSKTVQDVGKQLSLASARLGKLKAKVDLKNASNTMEFCPQELDAKEYAAKKKLQTVTAQYDGIVAENSKLRRDIDAILKDNVHVSKKLQDLEEEEAKKTAEIDELVDDATAAYDQREESVAKGNALSERNEKEKKQYNLEINELRRLIRHEEKLLDFMQTKNQSRGFFETDDERLSRLESAKEQTMDDRLESYQENLGKLLISKGQPFESLIDEYVNLWNGNVTKFAYINELNNDLEAIQAQVESLREEIKRSASDTVERNQERTAEIMKKEEELEILMDEYKTTENVVKSHKLVMEEIVKLIERMFYITDFEEAKPVLDLIGTGNEVSSQNAMLYLNILEGRINEIFNNVGMTARGRSGGGGSGRVTPKSPKLFQQPGKLSVSDITSTTQKQPRIVISASGHASVFAGQDESLSSGEDAGGSSIVEDEPTPLEYFEMRGKLLDNISVSRNPSVCDTESVINDADVEGE